MGTEMKKFIKLLILLVVAYALVSFGGLLIIGLIFESKKLDVPIFFTVLSAVATYLVASDLFSVKWKEKEGLQNGENQS